MKTYFAEYHARELIQSNDIDSVEVAALRLMAGRDGVCHVTEYVQQCGVCEGRLIVDHVHVPAVSVMYEVNVMDGAIRYCQQLCAKTMDGIDGAEGLRIYCGMPVGHAGNCIVAHMAQWDRVDYETAAAKRDGRKPVLPIFTPVEEVRLASEWKRQESESVPV